MSEQQKHREGASTEVDNILKTSMPDTQPDTQYDHIDLKKRDIIKRIEKILLLKSTADLEGWENLVECGYSPDYLIRAIDDSVERELVKAEEGC